MIGTIPLAAIYQKSYESASKNLDPDFGLTQCLNRCAVLQPIPHFAQKFCRFGTNRCPKNVERLQEALKDEKGKLETLVEDWGAWSDTYTFVKDRNPEYLQDNLNDNSILSIEVNFLLLLNEKGEIIFSKGLSLGEETEGESIPISPALKSLIAPNEKQVGMVLLPEDPLMIASHPILTSEGEGPSRGTLIMARYLDDSMIGDLSDRTRLTNLDKFILANQDLPSDCPRRSVNRLRSS
ncbi:MAG: hypothetical protein HC796_11460 [Synechococcaceae cyanobacterium RL_1_2]|nr:hypothetical protein [Synechococcaceae cyanobacterium RL_1_2]